MMRTTKEEAERILEQIKAVAEARIRPMMGEYLLYVDDKLVGQINRNQLFIKITPFGESFAAGLERESPYDGAKPMFVVPQDRIDDKTWLREFIAGALKDLPPPKSK